jgi:hypothetical protein
MDRLQYINWRKVMAKMKDKVIDIIDLWVMGRSMVSIAATVGMPLDVVEYVINEYGTDVM